MAKKDDKNKDDMKKKGMPGKEKELPPFMKDKMKKDDKKKGKK